MTAVGDPAVGGVDASTVELKVVVLAALVTKASFNAVVPGPVEDPVLVDEINGSTVELALTPEESTRDEACALRSVLVLAALAAEASFKGMVTVLPQAGVVTAVATLVRALDNSVGPGWILLSPDGLVLARRDGRSATPPSVVTVGAKASFGFFVGCG